MTRVINQGKNFGQAGREGEELERMGSQVGDRRGDQNKN